MVPLVPSAKCFDLIKEFESCKLKAYPDPLTGGKPWTIGWGHTGPEVKPGMVITQAQADELLAKDVSLRALAVYSLLNGKRTTQGQFDALVSFGFNVGVAGSKDRPKLRESTLLRKHLAGDYAGAAAEFGKWINKGSNVEKGLRRRRAAEVALYQS